MQHYEHCPGNDETPVAKKEPKVLKIHGYELTDNYAWLRDRNKEKNPEIIKYLEAENAYTEAHMGLRNLSSMPSTKRCSAA